MTRHQLHRMKPSDYRINIFSNGCSVVHHTTGAPATDATFASSWEASDWIDREVAGLNVGQPTARARFLATRYAMTWPRYILGLTLTIAGFAVGMVIVRYDLGIWAGAVAMSAIFAAYSLAFQPILPRTSPISGDAK